jgi:hypothetical protein
MAAPDSRGWPYNPLTLDLDGDGIELSPQSSLMPTFDIDGDHYAERTAWPKPDDGILVRDLNGNGRIDDVTEMFGGKASGFAALAALDGNHDGKVDAADNGLADFNGDGHVDENDTIAALKVWRDLNEDAVTDPGELFSLAQLGIASISIGSTALATLDSNGDGRIDAADAEFASLRVWRDLNQNGVTGFAVHTGWFAPAEGILIRDIDHNSSVTADELFGAASANALTSGQHLSVNARGGAERI